ncbi:MAG: 3,5-nucleoside bisphosphate phosphatase [Halanaerobiales bacterium]|nr:3,5-nucleoside bisphosphate phosphatase [Halanaerobiales bacterium]
MKYLKRIDLHTHSAYSSDGEFKPASLVRLAGDAGLAAIALTDHNTMEGIPEAIEAGKKYGVEIVPGVEIDSQYGDYSSIHLLGYYLDPTAKKLLDFLQGMRDRYYQQAKKRVRRLQELGFEITYEEVLEFAPDIPVGVILAEVLLTNGKNNYHPALRPYLPGGERSGQPYFNFYLDFFTRGKIAYIPCEYPRSDEVIDLITTLGGIPVLAHPGSAFAAGNSKDIRAIKELIGAGLAGIEAYSTYHGPEEMEEFAQLAQKYNLLVTAGSDFHGKLKPKIAVGDVPNNNYQLLRKLKETAGSRS